MSDKEKLSTEELLEWVGEMESLLSELYMITGKDSRQIKQIRKLIEQNQDAGVGGITSVIKSDLLTAKRILVLDGQWKKRWDATWKTLVNDTKPDLEISEEQYMAIVMDLYERIAELEADKPSVGKEDIAALLDDIGGWEVECDKESYVKIVKDWLTEIGVEVSGVKAESGGEDKCDAWQFGRCVHPAVCHETESVKPQDDQGDEDCVCECVKWNPFNEVVQCHRCGRQPKPDTQDAGKHKFTDEQMKEIGKTIDEVLPKPDTDIKMKPKHSYDVKLKIKSWEKGKLKVRQGRENFITPPRICRGCGKEITYFTLACYDSKNSREGICRECIDQAQKPNEGNSTSPINTGNTTGAVRGLDRAMLGQVNRCLKTLEDFIDLPDIQAHGEEFYADTYGALFKFRELLQAKPLSVGREEVKE